MTAVTDRPTPDASGRGAAFHSPQGGETGSILEPTLFEISRSGRRAVRFPELSPAAQAAAATQPPIPSDARRTAATPPARGERARPGAPLQSPRAAEPRHRHRLLPAGLVHDEIQPQGQRVGCPPARPGGFAPARPRTDEPGQPRAAVAAVTPAGGDRRLRRGQPAARGRSPRGADRHADDPRVPSFPRARATSGASSSSQTAPTAPTRPPRPWSASSLGPYRRTPAAASTSTRCARRSGRTPPR